MKDIIIDFATQKIINGKIEAVQGDNTARKIKILLKENSNPYNLTGKSVMLTMRKNSSNSYVNKGDFMNLSITNAVGGEVELPINKAFTKEKGGYQLQLSVMNNADFEENTMLFEAVIHTNLREDVSGTLVESIIFQEIKQTLQEVKDIAKNEEQRKTNERQRVQNETTREEFFNTQTKPATEKVSGFIKQVSKNTKNIERVFEVLNENSFVPYSGEDVKIEHSKVGITKDMKIFGKTRYKRPNGTYTDIWEEGCTLESCGEAEGNKISILSNGDNIYNTTLIKGDIENTTGNFAPSESVVRTKDYVYIPKTQKIYFKINFKPDTDWIAVFFYDKDKKLISKADTWVLRNVSFDVPINARYLAFKINNVESIFIENIQLSYNQNSNYEPYKEDKKEILLPIEGGLKGFPSKAKDEVIIKDDGVYIKQNIGKVILESNSQTHTLSAYTTSTHVCFLVNMEQSPYNLPAYPNKVFGDDKVVCDKLPSNAIVTNTENVEGISAVNAQPNHMAVKILKSKLETPDTAGFKKWLQANPVTVYYQLANPIKTILSEIANLNMNTYNNITYINTLNAIKPTLSFKAPVNTPMLIGDLREKNSMLLVKNEELQNKNVELEKVNQRQTVEIIELNDTTNFLIEDALSRKLNN